MSPHQRLNLTGLAYQWMWLDAASLGSLATSNRTSKGLLVEALGAIPLPAWSSDKELQAYQRSGSLAKVSRQGKLNSKPGNTSRYH